MGLSDKLRRGRLGLKGTKQSCEVQVCGACTVLMDGLPVSSCCTLALEADGRDLMTIEGLGDAGDLHPVQEAFLRHDALQCGFCTPGMILAVKALFDLEPAPSDDDITHFLHGNICRCTGYVKILEAVKELRDG